MREKVMRIAVLGAGNAGQAFAGGMSHRLRSHQNIRPNAVKGSDLGIHWYSKRGGIAIMPGAGTSAAGAGKR